MMKTTTKSKPVYVLVGGLIAAMLQLIVAQLVDRPQCPEQNQELHREATNCIVGANIGLSLLYLLALSTILASVILATHYYLAEREQKMKKSNKS